MRRHRVHRAQAIGHRLVGAQQYLFHGNVGKTLRLHHLQQAAHLVGGGHQRRKDTPWTQRLAHLRDEFPRLAHIQKERINAFFNKTIVNAAQMHGHMGQQANTLQIGARPAVGIFTILVGVDHASRRHRPRQRHRQPRAARTRLNHAAARAQVHAIDKPRSILGVNHLRTPFEMAHQVFQCRLKRQPLVARGAGHRLARGAPHNVGMGKDTHVRVQFLAGAQPHKVAALVARNQEHKVVQRKGRSARREPGRRRRSSL